IYQLRKLQHKEILLDEMIDMSLLKERNKEIRLVSPVHVTGRIDYSPTRIVCSLQITGTLTLPCSRTLVDVVFPFDIHTIETFLPSSEALDDTEECHLLEGEVLDLFPVIEDNILIEIPMQ